jgi:hypothetical protein
VERVARLLGGFVPPGVHVEGGPKAYQLIHLRVSPAPHGSPSLPRLGRWARSPSA